MKTKPVSNNRKIHHHLMSKEVDRESVVININKTNKIKSIQMLNNSSLINVDSMVD
jgi:hypothetical protein